MRVRRSPTLELVARIQEERANGRQAWSLSTPTFPPPGGLPAPGADWTTLSAAKGLPELREAARATLFANWDLPGHDCLITAGAKAAIFAVLRAACEPGSAVLVVTPAWPSYFDVCAAATLNARPFQTNFAEDFRIDLAALDATAASAGVRAIILSNPCNPTGRILSRDEMAGLAALAERRGLTLIIDQSFSGFVFDEARWRASVAAASDRIVVIDSFSKNWTLQGARLGAALLPDWLVEPAVTVHQTVLSAAPTPSQLMALHLIKTGAKPPPLAAQRLAAAQFMDQMGWPYHPQTGAFYYFPFVERIDAFREMAARRSVFFLAGDAFGAAYGRHFRLCFCKPLSELTAVFERLQGSGGEA